MIFFFFSTELSSVHVMHSTLLCPMFMYRILVAEFRLIFIYLRYDSAREDLFLHFKFGVVGKGHRCRHERLWVRFPSLSNQTQCRHRLATPATFFWS